MEESNYAGPERRVDHINLPKHVAYLVLGVLIVSVLVGITGSVSAVVIALRVKDNSHAIQTAGYETCVRGNGVRAELQFRASLTPPELAKSLIKRFRLPADLADATSADAVRSRLPIYDCNPLIENKPAELLTIERQKRYVERFAKGLTPLPPP